MKNLSLAILLLFSLSSGAQTDFEMFFETTEVYGSSSQTELVAKGYVKNMTGSTKTFSWYLINPAFPNNWVVRVKDKNKMHDASVQSESFTLNDGDSGIIELHVTLNNTKGMGRCSLDVIKQDDPFDIMEGIFTFHAWTAGFDDPVYPAGFTVFPNPANNTLNISLKEDAPVTLNIYNTLGQLQLQHLHNAQTSEINLAPLQPGLYFIKYTTENGNTVSEKFFKAE